MGSAPASPGDKPSSYFAKLLTLKKVEKETSEAQIILQGSGPAGMTHGVKVGDVATMNSCVTKSEHPATKPSLDSIRE